MGMAPRNGAQPASILLVEDEPLILIDLEYAAEDLGSVPICAQSCAEALAHIETMGASLSAAVLDVSLGGGETCLPVAQALDRLGVPYILHSGDLDRREEQIRKLDAQLIAKPAQAEAVIAAALALARREGDGTQAMASR